MNYQLYAEALLDFRYYRAENANAGADNGVRGKDPSWSLEKGNRSLHSRIHQA